MLEQKLCLQVFHMHTEGSLDIYFPLGAGYSYKYSTEWKRLQANVAF